MTASITSPTASDKITVLFVGSNPSNASTVDAAFHGSTKSSKILTRWTKDIDAIKIYINVLNEKTENNRPLKNSEIKSNLPQLKTNIQAINPDRVVALGKTAAKALTLLHIAHYEMPHPSGRNRKLNDKNYEEQKVKGLTEYCHSVRPLESLS